MRDRNGNRRPAARPPVSPGPGGSRRAPRGSAVLLCVGLLLSALVAGCGEDLDARSGMVNSFPSAESSTQAVLDALAANDREAVQALLLTDEEHRTLLWDQLPERNYFSFEYVADLKAHSNEEGVQEALASYGGQQFEVVSIEFEKGVEEYEGFRLHRGAKLTVRRVSDGREGEIDLVDVFVERNGGWKPMNYRD